jgi:hypothetical protein
MSGKAGHEGPHRMQARLRSYKWSWEKARTALPALAAACLADDPDDLIGPGVAFDETADLKKGSSTAILSRFSDVDHVVDGPSTASWTQLSEAGTYDAPEAVSPT